MLDLVQRFGAWHTTEAEAHDLVQRRAFLGVASGTTRDAHHERAGADTHARRLGRRGDQLCFDSFDALGQGRATEQRARVVSHCMVRLAVSGAE